MKIINNKYLPFGRFDVMNILGFLFIKENTKLSNKLLNHEAIHTEQQIEIMTVSALIAVLLSNWYYSFWYLLIVIALPIIIYLLAWIIELLLPPYDSAYKDSPFEREAYANEDDMEYLITRVPFAWVYYILKDRRCNINNLISKYIKRDNKQ